MGLSGIDGFGKDVALLVGDGNQRLFEMDPRLWKMVVKARVVHDLDEDNLQKRCTSQQTDRPYYGGPSAGTASCKVQGVSSEALHAVSGV